MDVELEDAEPLVLYDWRTHDYDNGDKYRIMGPIGNTTGDGATVYKAQCSHNFTSTDDENIHRCTVAMRYVKVSDVEAFKNLESQARKHKWCRSVDESPKLLEIFHNKGYYCVVFYYMNHGSLLTLMSHHFPRGLPENYILYVLYQTILTANTIHATNRFHREISAAHIYGIGNWNAAYANLGFACTVFDVLWDQARDEYDTGYMAGTSVCRWAAAPEVYYGPDDGGYDGVKADVWLIGITALELAYGGLKLRSRDDLESLLRNIHQQKDLPKKLNQDDRRTWEKEKRLLHFLPSSLNTNKRLAPTRFQFTPKERLFSKEFVDLVLACLDFDPSKRPTPHDLIQYQFLYNAWFYNGPIRFPKPSHVP